MASIAYLGPEGTFTEAALLQMIDAGMVPQHSPDTVRRLQAMSPRTMDRVLHDRRQALQRRLYGRTKPGTLLKHQIPLKTDRWDVTVPASPRSTWSPTPGP